MHQLNSGNDSALSLNKVHLKNDLAPNFFCSLRVSRQNTVVINLC